MSAGASWGEVRWREPQSSSNARDSTMATREVLAMNSFLVRDGHKDQYPRPMESTRRIDHAFHAPQPTLHIGGPLWDTETTTLLSEQRLLSDHVSRPFDRPPNSTVASHLGNDDGGSISTVDQAVSTSRRTSWGLPSMSGQYRASPPMHTSLPPIASLQESVNHDRRQGTEPQTIIKSESPTCRGCIEKKTIIDDIALAVTSLDELINSHGFRPFKRRSERPQDCSLRTARWVLDCVEDARASLQGSSPDSYLDSNGLRRSNIVEPALVRSLSPHGVAKRGTDPCDRDDGRLIKRQRTSSYTENHLDRFRVAANLEEHRRASDSTQRSEPFRTHSPAHSDSWTSQQRSPNSHGHSLRPLPSPSSLATAPQKGSLGGLAVLPESSPTSVPHGLPSIHNVTTSSATAQHIADLQHQITLKSLALQTLQSEYTALLQKSQRDRLRTQTLEKKTCTAENEINELTTRNEELVEQTRILETQLEECERKRESERSDAAREKEQWGKMLEMSGRLQAKSTDDRQKLVQEKESLQQRLLIHENEAALRAKRSTTHAQKAISPSVVQDSGGAEQHGTAKEESTQASSKFLDLQYENEVLQRRTYLLRSVLERIELQYAAFVEDRRKLMEKETACIPDAIQMVLREDSAFARPKDRYSDEPGIARCDSTQTPGKRRSAEPSPSRTDNQARGFGNIAASEANSEDAESSHSRPTDTSPSATKTPSTSPPSSTATLSKTATRPKLQAVPLPKWQPPNTSAIRTDVIGNNQRDPSGPATPFPNEVPTQKQALETMHAQRSLQSGKASSPPQAPLPAFGTEKSPARNYSPQYTAPTKVSATGSGHQNQDPSAAAAAAMPPPPRPGSEVDAASSTTTSWRSS